MASSLQDYLKRYTSSSTCPDSGKGKSKKKRKRKEQATPSGKGVVIVDDDAPWQIDVKLDDEDGSDPGEGPTVIEDVEVKRMHRLESLKTHRPYLSVANDGSGWVTVRDDPEAAPDVKGWENGSGSSPSHSAGGKSPHISLTRGGEYSPDLSPLRKNRDSGIVSDDSPRSRSPNRSKFENVSPLRERIDVRDSQFRSRPDSPEVLTSRTIVDVDMSPPRRSKSSSKWSEPRDLSPPRERADLPDRLASRKKLVSSDGSQRRIVVEDLSLPRRPKFGPPASDSSKAQDLSPPRRKYSSGFSASMSTRPSANIGQRSEDMSPPRKSKLSKGGSGAQDLFRSPRRKDHSDVSPPRRRHDSPDVPRGRRAESRNVSPTRKAKNSNAARTRDDSEDLTPPLGEVTGRMTDGAFAGLKSGRGLFSEAERKRAAEAKSLAELDPSLSGRGAATVFRDKRGKRLEGLEEMLRQQKGELKPAEQPLEWGKGLAQKKKAAEDLAELEVEKSKPFARYRDDPELEKAQKERLRWGDPMAHLVKQKITDHIEDLGAREEMKASGFIVPQNIPNHSWLKRGIVPPPNRYGIKPGRHWDGVDRSTGFEQGCFKEKNEKKARDLEAYLWSVSDM